MASKFFGCLHQIIFDQTYKYTQQSFVSYVHFHVAITSKRQVRLEEMVGCVHLLIRRQAAFSEAALLKRLGHHPNIVPWIGHLQVSKGSSVCNWKQPSVVVRWDRAMCRRRNESLISINVDVQVHWAKAIMATCRSCLVMQLGPWTPWLDEIESISMRLRATKAPGMLADQQCGWLCNTWSGWWQTLIATSSDLIPATVWHIWQPSIYLVHNTSGCQIYSQ